MVLINYDSDNHELTVDGHANFAKTGEDIVCAAISILVYTLGACLSEEYLDETIEMEIGVGRSRIKCVPKEEYIGNVDLIYATIITGFELLAKVYPANVKLKVI